MPEPSSTSHKGSAGKAWLLGMTKGDLHPCDDGGGWPEFEITLSFYVSSDDPELAERERERIWASLPDVVIEVTDG